jgi:putative spermidine/putrescine transport system substrate-binding protein
MNNTKVILLSLIAPIWLALAGSAAAADVICYNCPPEWADWASMLRAIKADLGYDIPFDNKNSGQALSQLIAEKNNPVADLAYYGVNFGMKAKAAGVHDAYKPKDWEDVPAALKDPDGSYRARFPSCSITISTPIAPSTVRREVSSSSSPAKARLCFLMWRAW